MNWWLAKRVQDELAYVRARVKAIRLNRRQMIEAQMEHVHDAGLRRVYQSELRASDDPGADLDYVPDWAEKL